MNRRLTEPPRPQPVITLTTPDALAAKLTEIVRCARDSTGADYTGLTSIDLANLATVLAGMMVGSVQSTVRSAGGSQADIDDILADTIDAIHHDANLAATLDAMAELVR